MDDGKRGSRCHERLPSDISERLGVREDSNVLPDGMAPQRRENYPGCETDAGEISTTHSSPK